MTVNELLIMCLRRIGVVGQGNTAQPEALIQALGAFNAFVDALGANRLMLYGETRTTWTIVSGTQSYAVGAAQAVNRVRPVYVEQLGSVAPIRYIDTAGDPDVELPLQLLNDQQWRAVSTKALTGVLPSVAFYDPTYPFGSIKLWPVPTSSTLQGVLYAPTSMAEFALSDTIALPPGYRRFLVTNVALELCPEFERTPPVGLPQLAAQAKADVERVNMRLTEMATDPMWSMGGGSVYNIYSGP